ncbi:TetR/AcrR family transcriptional regulator [Actinomadura roseirufa]|uniref:TetR/AcrR family transcriptional regulator n=1 Tax=Actinomadura roseirufa TaxID=2094049 RepID=UPI00104111F0|nr:TetR/AcrR family transcriptional regulator [Actinomadura roseirufa]
MSDPRADGLVETATRLFAQLGYDGTSVQMIAEAAGVSPAVLREAAGTKAELYLAVMRHADDLEQRAVRAAITSFTPEIQGVIALAEAFLDFHASHPDVLALWMQRWMGDAADVPGLEELYTRPLSALVTDRVRQVVPDDVDADHLTWTVVWCVFGFLSGGITYTGDATAPVVRPVRGQGVGAPRPGDLARFRQHLRTLLFHMLTPC